ncbi:ZIP Zinc transporter [Colletotrichum graminicola]|uniref:ZIP Zinc transporter n=1 Tax=Colletotrichum graminicola (strain M1.001 / M2 / FGSC 10212) TaxID=645133 RepID=E3QH16_COLGM|nr:ZIP Zinc transporter [Colletotrichum graminicola M1.001]EFQ30178.1 ZIP Zinc transporter [Colletotrichum graminicola M1.001]WDK09159.1 ZIP Zinc transporter [Colletotrichum graminicola]
MNCPSRNDDITLEHPDWNQNPPFLAADLTTCEDLNGIANAREQRHARGGAGDGSDGRGDDMNYQTLPHLRPDRRSPVSGGRNYGFRPRNRKVHGGDGHTPLLRASAPEHSALWGWVSWAMSVLGCSAIISALRSPEAVVSFLVASHQTARSVVKRSARSVRRSTCPTGGLGDEDTYNTPLHVGALFIILAVSFLACAFPLAAAATPGVRVPRAFFFAVRHFGTGVLLATAFVHLLPTAFTLLGNQCLSSFWVEDYPAMPGAIALAGIFLVTIIEMVFHPGRHMTCVPGGNRTTDDDDDDAVFSPQSAVSLNNDNSPLEMTQSRGGGAVGSLGRTHARIGRGDDQQAQTRSQTGSRLPKRVDEADRAARLEAAGPVVLSPAQQHQKDILQCMMLEVGILFHSVFIGMTLSVSVGSEFVVLLIAIAFHQTFEGLALGSRIAAIDWPKGSRLQPWAMALAYGCTTPVGQAIGLATHRLYSPDSEFGLVLVGTMNALSSGLLVFAALVELLAEDFLSDESWRVLRGRKRVWACLLVFFGAFGMSLVGAWA